MTTTNATFNPMQFIDDNFDYINLLMLAGLYIVCFIYLLQDTVKTVKTGFANMIGIFVGQFFFLLFVVYALPSGTEYRTFWYSIVITLIIEFISSFLLLIKYKNLQDTNTDDVVLESTIAGTKYKLTGPYSPKDFYTNALISCDVIIAFFTIVLLKNGNDNVDILKTLIYYLQPIVIPIILLLSTVMFYYSATAYSVSPPNNKPSPAMNSKTIPALIFICLLNVLFVFFLSFLITKYDVMNGNLMLKLSWGGMFISSLFQIISVFIVVVSYKYLNDNYLSKNIPLSYSNLLNQELKDYNNLFVAVTSMMIVYMSLLMYNNEYLKNQTAMFFEPFYYSGFFYAVGIAMISMSSEMIKIGDDFLWFTKNAPKNWTDNDLKTVNDNYTTTPSS